MRPMRDGVEYFPLDTDFLQDDKIRLLKTEFGAPGILILVALLCDIYRGSGYYKHWDSDARALLADAVGCGVGPDEADRVVRGCVRRGIFDAGVFAATGVLTSVGIQRRYIRAISRREQIRVYEEYWLLDMDDRQDVPAQAVGKLTVCSLSADCMQPVDIGTQSKAKESKGEQSRAKDACSEHACSEHACSEHACSEHACGAPDAAAPPPEKKQALYDKYGRDQVDDYLARAANYRKTPTAILNAAAEWLARDWKDGKIRRPRSAFPPIEDSSLDFTEYEEKLRQFVPVFQKKGSG